MKLQKSLREDSLTHNIEKIENLALTEYPHFALANSEENWQRSLNFANDIRKDFDCMVIVGIGGSCLGGKTLCHYFSPYNTKVDFWDSADLDFLEARWSLLKSPEKTHFIVVSKSGSTLETFAGRDFVLAKLEALGLDFSKQMSVITEEKPSKLFDWHKANDLKFLAHPLDIGGRFSALTVVGLTPVAFLLGDKFMDEFKKADAWQVTRDLNEACEEFMASWQRGEWQSIFWPYEEKLRYVGPWIQQLWAESLGKKKDLNGKNAPRVSSPVSLHGSKDQHSVLQQIAEAYPDKLVCFFNDKSIQKEDKDLVEIMKSQTPISLNGIVNQLKLDFDHIWDLFLSFEYFIIQLGRLLNIDPFDQPGVEASKVLFKKRISELEGVLK